MDGFRRRPRRDSGRGRRPAYAEKAVSSRQFFLTFRDSLRALRPLKGKAFGWVRRVSHALGRTAVYRLFISFLASSASFSTWAFTSARDAILTVGRRKWYRDTVIFFPYRSP